MKTMLLDEEHPMTTVPEEFMVLVLDVPLLDENATFVVTHELLGEVSMEQKLLAPSLLKECTYRTLFEEPNPHTIVLQLLQSRMLRLADPEQFVVTTPFEELALMDDNTTLPPDGRHPRYRSSLLPLHPTMIVVGASPIERPPRSLLLEPVRIMVIKFLLGAPVALPNELPLSLLQSEF